MVVSFDFRASNDLEIQCEPHHGKRSQFSAGNFDIDFEPNPFQFRMPFDP